MRQHIVTTMMVQVFCLTLPLPLFAQGNDGCAEVLALTGRNEHYSYQRQVAMRVVYDDYCSGSKIKSDVSVGLEVTDLLDAFDLGFGSSKEKLEWVCREYRDLANAQQTSVQQTSVVVKEAIAAWRDCRRIAQSGLDVKPAVLNTQFTLDFQRWGAEDIAIGGFVYNSDSAECRGDTAEGKDQVLDRASKVILEPKKWWSAVCARKIKTNGTIAYYPEVEVSIPTTARGTFALRVPRSVLPELTWSVQIWEQLTNLEGDIAGLKAQVFKDRPSAPAAVILPRLPGEGYWGDWTNDYYCPGNHYVCGLRVKIERDLGKGGDDTGLNAVELKCCPF